MKIPRMIATVGISTLVLSAAACSSSDDSTSAQSSGDADLTIGFAIPAANQTYWTAYQNGVKDAAAEMGVSVVFADAKDDANTQVEQVSSFIVSGVDGVVIAPTDTVGPIVALSAVSDAGLPLITSNRLLDTTYGGAGGALPEVHVGFDDVKLGELQGEMVVDACEGIDPCNVALLMATLGSSPQIQRTEGLHNVIDNESNIVMLDEQADDFDSQKAQDLTSNYLQKFPELNLIVSQYDEMAVASARVIADAGKADDIRVIGLGGSENGIAAVTDGTLLGTVWVSPKRDGVTALETMVHIIKGEDLTTLGDVNGIPTVPVGAEKVTAENVADYPGEW